jgi:hypothetical protein
MLAYFNFYFEVFIYCFYSYSPFIFYFTNKNPIRNIFVIFTCAYCTFILFLLRTLYIQLTLLFCSPVTVVGKLLLKSNRVTLLPLLLKETSFFKSIINFPCKGSVTVTNYCFLESNEIVTSYSKK